MLQPYTVGRLPERIDRIARRLYGSERGGTVERIFAANPGLSAHGAFVPAGTVIAVPAAAATSTLAFTPPWS